MTPAPFTIDTLIEQEGLTTPPPPSRFVRLIDDPPPEPPDIIDDFLPSQGVALISGPTNVGKSLLAIETCSALVSERPLWGCLRPKKKAEKITYFLAEHDTSVLQRLWRLTGLPMTKGVYLIGPKELEDHKYLSKNGQVLMSNVNLLSAEAEGSGLIVFDPLSAFVVGSENDNNHMRDLVGAMSLVCQKVGCPGLVLGHFGKPALDAFGNTLPTRPTYGTRGASSIEDAFPTVHYFLEPEVENGPFTLRTRKYKGAMKERKLVRDADTLTHTYINRSRPNVELKRIEFRKRVEEAMAGGLSKTEAVEGVAADQGISPATAWRYISDESKA